MVDIIIMVGLGLFVLAAVLFVVWFFALRRRPRRLNQPYFQERWLSLQKQLSDKASWAQVVLDADKLLDEALKKKRIRGKGMGERLVHVQRILTDNDSVWFGHKLRSKIEQEPDTKLKEADVKQALIGIRQALKDLGALPNGQQRDSK